MDMNMPVMSGVEAPTRSGEHPNVKVLALTAFGDMTLVTAMVKAGASGYLLKGGSSEELIQSLQAIVKGHAALDKEVTRGSWTTWPTCFARSRSGPMLAELRPHEERVRFGRLARAAHSDHNIKGGVVTLQTNWGAIDDRVKLELLDSMGTECERLSRMVSQILTASGIQRGGLGLRPTLFSVAVVAQAAVASSADRLAGREISCNFEEIYSSGDEERLTEVIAALIENSIDFTSGRISVDVKAVLGTPLLSVSDEGPGIAPEDVRRLLNEPFSQADSSSTRQVGGLGLSLDLARQVAEASGGRLEVDTAPDRGSTFTLILRPV